MQKATLLLVINKEKGFQVIKICEVNISHLGTIKKNISRQKQEINMENKCFKVFVICWQGNVTTYILRSEIILFQIA